jgi:hypothetical protein
MACVSEAQSSLIEQLSLIWGSLGKSHSSGLVIGTPSLTIFANCSAM